MKITAAQKQALAKIRQAGTVYAYNGVSVATARALAAKGLVRFDSYGVQLVPTRRSYRSVADWSVTAI